MSEHGPTPLDWWLLGLAAVLASMSAAILRSIERQEAVAVPPAGEDDSGRVISLQTARRALRASQGDLRA